MHIIQGLFDGLRKAKQHLATTYDFTETCAKFEINKKQARILSILVIL